MSMKGSGRKCPGRVPAAFVCSWGVQPLFKQGHKQLSWAGSRTARVNKRSVWYISAHIVISKTTLADYTFSYPILLNVCASSDHHWVVFLKKIKDASHEGNYR